MRFRIFGAQLNVGFSAVPYVPTINPQTIPSITPDPQPQATATWGSTTAPEDADPGWTGTGALLSPGDYLTISEVPPRTFTFTVLWRLDRYPLTGSSWLLDLGGFGLEIAPDGRFGWRNSSGTQLTAETLPLGRWMPMSVIADGTRVDVALDNLLIGSFSQGAQTPTAARIGGGQGGLRVAHAALYRVAVSRGAQLHLFQYLLEVGRRMNVPVGLVDPEDPAMYAIPGTDNFRTGNKLYDTVFTRPSAAWR